MTIGESFLPEFDAEMATTRRVLERVPSERGEWKPHPKSFALGHLAQLVARMPGWLPRMLKNSEIELTAFPAYSLESTPKLLSEFDRNVKDAREAFSTVPDAEFDAPWSLKRGGQTIMTMPRLAVVRQSINHLVHHRGQLSVYLRLNDVPVPSIYGPTADEHM
jgi:uncharacterized damage-inducible protein DinB